MKSTTRLKTLMLSFGLLALSGCDQNAQKVLDLEKEKADLSAALASEKQNVAAAEEKATDIADLTKQLGIAQAEAKSLVEDITEVNTRAATAENALAALQTKSAAAQAELAAAQAKLEEAGKAAALAAAESATAIETLKQQVADLTAALAKLKPTLPGGDLPSTP